MILASVSVSVSANVSANANANVSARVPHGWVADAFDRRAAEAALAVVEHDVLARRRRALRLLEAHLERAGVGRQHGARLVRLPIADLRGAAQRPSRRERVGRRADPAGAGGREPVVEQQRMIVTLHDDELVVLAVLA